MKRVSLLLLLALLSLAASATKIDSLELALQKETTYIKKISIYNDLAGATASEDPNRAIRYLVKSLAIYNTVKKDTTKAFQEVAANLFESLGSCYNLLGDNKKAIQYILESKKIAEHLNDPKIMATAYTSLGHLYNFTSQNENAVSFHSKALKCHEQLKDKRGIAEAYNNIGLAYYGLGKTDLTAKFFLKALELRKKLGNQKDIAQSLNNVAFLYKNMGDSDKCMKYLLESLKMREKIGDKNDIANSCNNIGYLYRQKENYSLALKYYTKAASIFEETGKLDSRATALHNIALMYEQSNQLELAKKYTLQGLELARKVDAQDQIAGALNTLSAISRRENKFDDALDLQLQALEIRRKIKDKNGIANSLQNLGVLKSRMGDNSTAIKYLNEALTLFRELKEVDDISTCLDKLGSLYFEIGNKNQALIYFQESFDLGIKLGFPNLVHSTSRKLAELYSYKKDYTKAFNYLWRYTLLNDSSAKSENMKLLHDMEEKYKSEKHKKELELNKVRLAKKDAEIRQKDLADEKKNNLLIFSFGAIALVLTLVFVLLSSNNRKKKANQTITFQKLTLEQKNKEIVDSITYAKRLQDAILPPSKIIQAAFGDNHFIYYAPKDIVAGDFYWLEEMETVDGKFLFFAAADCTGHGVPGAMVSVVCSNALNRATRELQLTDPGNILDKCRELVLETFARSEGGVKDGMDISLCSWNKTTNVLKWAGANNPLWIIRNGECITFKADKQPIGKTENPVPFQTHIIPFQSGDMLYLFTDGFSDQFGGEKGKKLKQANFQQLLIEMAGNTTAEQNIRLNVEYQKWKGKFEQTDDVCVIGIRI